MNASLRLVFYIGLHSSFAPNSPSEVAVRKGAALRYIGHAFPDGLTAVRSVGHWRGEEEPALRVEVLSDDSPDTRERARRLAELLAVSLKQECVGLTFDTVDFQLVSAGPLRADLSAPTLASAIAS
jgi:hypothetical protein